MGVCFSPDDRIIASASADRTIKLWNHDGDLISTLQSHDNWVMGVAFDSTGQLLASASADNTVKLWNLQKLESELTLEQLVRRGCSWLHNYLTNNPTISQEDKSLCHEICSEATENV